jgi:hypothetical protein
MNAQSKIEAPLAFMRAAFPDHHISKLPKPTKAQTETVKADFKKGIRCKICGSWHHPDVVHLDYVGHAALTDRLLDTDIEWTWEPLALDQNGLPALDQNRGLWIKLTVAGVTRLGYGSADGKQGGDAIKEIIGDALRNAAMRFGAALDLWHKGDLHLEDDSAVEAPGGDQGHILDGTFSPDPQSDQYTFPEGPAKNITGLKNMCRSLWREIEGCGDDGELNALLNVDENKALMKQLSNLENPSHREIWEGDGKDNPGVAGLITRKETEFAQHMIELAHT